MMKSTTQRRPEESHMDKTALSCLISPTIVASASDANTDKNGSPEEAKKRSEEDDSEVYIRSLPKARSIQEILKDHNNKN